MLKDYLKRTEKFTPVALGAVSQLRRYSAILPKHWAFTLVSTGDANLQNR